MHLRQVKYRGGKRLLRYLHAIRATVEEPAKIEGMICGPDVFWQYQIISSRGRPQLNVLAEFGPDDELDRIGRQFVPEILRRIKQEHAVREEPRTTYLEGQVYLRRKQGGMRMSHRHCQLALKRRVLNEKFVAKLEPWDLELVCP